VSERHASDGDNPDCPEPAHQPDFERVGDSIIVRLPRSIPSPLQIFEGVRALIAAGRNLVRITRAWGCADDPSKNRFPADHASQLPQLLMELNRVGSDFATRLSMARWETDPAHIHNELDNYWSTWRRINDGLSAVDAAFEPMKSLPVSTAAVTSFNYSLDGLEVLSAGWLEAFEEEEERMKEHAEAPIETGQPLHSFLDFSTKQRKLLTALDGNGKVSIDEVLLAVYESRSRNKLETLLKLKDRTNEALTKKLPSLEIKKAGETFCLTRI
jgi:hypothetical protein